MRKQNKSFSLNSILTLDRQTVPKMGLFEQLVPLVHFGQIVGLFPYRIQRNASTGQFKSFTFSWGNKTTIYFVFATSFQFFVPLTANVMFQKVMHNKFDEAHLSTMFVVLSRLGSVIHYLMIILGLAITLRYHKLRSAVQSITNKVFTDLESLEDFKISLHNIKQRIYGGIFLILILVNRFINICYNFTIS